MVMLAPTRELAAQLHRESIRLAKVPPHPHWEEIYIYFPATSTLYALIHLLTIIVFFSGTNSQGTGIRVVLLTKALSVSAGVAESALKKNSGDSTLPVTVMVLLHGSQATMSLQSTDDFCHDGIIKMQ